MSLNWYFYLILHFISAQCRQLILNCTGLPELHQAMDYNVDDDGVQRRLLRSTMWMPDGVWRVAATQATATGDTLLIALLPSSLLSFFSLLSPSLPHLLCHIHISSQHGALGGRDGPFLVALFLSFSSLLRCCR